MNHTITPDIISFSLDSKRKIQSDDQLEILKQGTLHILEEIGIYMPNDRALKIFSDHGAVVDFHKKNVKIPADLVEKALACAPSSFVLGGRERRFDLHIGGKSSFHIPSSCGVNFVDPGTREKRASTKADLEQVSRVFDALPIFNIVRPIVSACDFGMTSALHECHAMLTNSLKHIRGGTTMHPSLAPFLVEMATTVSGSKKKLRQRPIVNANICSIAPLAHDAHGIECALTYAEAGIPVSFMAVPTMGTTGPAHPMASLIVGEAEIISGVALLQLAFPGTPAIHSNQVAVMDPISARCILDVSQPVAVTAVQMAKQIWKLPSLGGVMGCNNARDIGWESGMVDGQASILMYLDGPDILGSTCLLNDSMTLYPEYVLLVNETLERAYEFLHPLDFTENDLAIDVVQKVGAKGHFLMEPHTLKQLRELRHAKMLRQPRKGEGERDARQVALDTYIKIGQSHFPEPLPEDVLKELGRILDRADREGRKIG